MYNDVCYYWDSMGVCVGYIALARSHAVGTSSYYLHATHPLRDSTLSYIILIFEPLDDITNSFSESPCLLDAWMISRNSSRRNSRFRRSVSSISPIILRNLACFWGPSDFVSPSAGICFVGTQSRKILWSLTSCRNQCLWISTCLNFVKTQCLFIVTLDR